MSADGSVERAQSEPDGAQPDQAEFARVLADELQLLGRLRIEPVDDSAAPVYARARNSNLAGLAFSGGGIRSATFNLGVIQALARLGLLQQFDYLSTVSGGGYIGGWLSALLHRKAAGPNGVDQRAVADFQAALKTHPDTAGVPHDQTNVGFAPVEHIAVRYLRRYSNYLTPRLGLSGDTLAAVAIFLRNFTLIQLSLISLVAAVLLAAQVVAALSVVARLRAPGLSEAFALGLGSLGLEGQAWLAAFGDRLAYGWPFLLAALFFLFAIWSAGRLLPARGTQPQQPALASRQVNRRVAWPLLVGGWWFSVGSVTWWERLAQNQPTVEFDLVTWMLAGGLGYAAAWILGSVAARPGHARSARQELVAALRDPQILLPPLVAGAALGTLLYLGAVKVVETAGVTPIALWHAVAWGPPLLILTVLFAVTLHLGAARGKFSEQDREWLARLGGYLLLYGLGWMLVFVLVLYAAPFVNWLAGGGLAVLATWAGGSALGAYLGRQPSTGGATQGFNWKEVVTRSAPWLFLAGLAILVAYATHQSLLQLDSVLLATRGVLTDFSAAAQQTLAELQALNLSTLLVAFLTAAGVFLLVSWRLDINLFSLHALYCNRLARAYLGASHAGHRQPNPFTGFDPDDDLPFHALGEQRPIHIINTAINMTGGDDLAWQTRRAASFSFTPQWAGFETSSSQGERLGSYRPTRAYAGGHQLGTLMAISGAAASPNMGYHTSPPVAALMTAFNLRLGCWCGNPVAGENDNSEVWKQASPRFAAMPMVAELSGSATAQADWINLTDGGHFENLGVYELVRRRCRLIVVTDAGCDPKHHFEDLANLLRMCWTDLGVNIRFADFAPVRLPQDSRHAAAHGATGLIQYPDGGPDGVIIYLKASMTGDEWPDIRQYADLHPDFPHQTTADQFFDENQFEAYRHLGYKVTAKMMGEVAVRLDRDPAAATVGEIVQALQAKPALP